MARLTEAEKQEIVTLLARFHSPTQVVVHMREHWGLDVDRFQVRTYDPANPRYEAGPKWREIFEATRAAYLNSIEHIPIARAAYRLNELQNIYDRAVDMGNLPLAKAILRQAAWETRGAQVGEARPVANAGSGCRHMTYEERRAELNALWERACIVLRPQNPTADGGSAEPAAPDLFPAARAA